MAQFYSEIEPLILELEKKKVDNPVGMAQLLGGSQKLVKFENSSEIKVDGLWHIRLLFKKIRSFAPNSYNIEFCQIYLDNKNGETQKSLVGHFFPEDKETYFNLANKTDDDIEDYVIMSICFIFQENDDEIWKEFLKAKKIDMNLRFKYRNAFKIETKSSIRVAWSNPKSQYGYKKFKAADYYIYENKHSLLSEKN